jgi:hypothetical protein
VRNVKERQKNIHVISAIIAVINEYKIKMNSFSLISYLNDGMGNVYTPGI